MMTPISAPHPVRALVCHGLTETPYTRAGSGPPVVLVAADPDLRTSLLTVLSRRFLTIAPDLPAPSDPGFADPTFSSWLNGFLDALGIRHAALVTDNWFGATAIAFAITDPDRTDAVVIAYRASADMEPATAIAGRIQRENDLLLIWLDDAADSWEAVPDAIARVIRLRDGFVSSSARLESRDPL